MAKAKEKAKERAKAQAPTTALEMTATASVKRHPDNPRVGDVAAIKRSVTTLGVFYSAVVVQKSTRYVIAGNHRHQAAEELGLAQIPAVIVDVDDATAKRIMLADNRIADLGDYDPIAMLEVMTSIRNDGATLDGTGYEDEDIAVVVDLARGADDADVASAVREWDAESVDLSAEFFIRGPAELQPKIRAVLEREFPGVKFTESIARS